MAQNRSKMAKTESDGSRDFISNLPEELRSKILSFLPIKEAVKTSILSSKWRTVWASMPEISINDLDFAPYAHIPRHYQNNLVKFVDILLLLHKGPIQKFQINSAIFTSDALDRWILKLSRLVIRSIYLDLTSRDSYKVHSSLFSCNSLQNLHLCNCSLKLPRDFKGFKMIQSIELQNCAINGDDFEKLVSNCPLLEELSIRALKDSTGMNLAINAPKLKKLVIDTNFASLVLKTPLLVKACIELEIIGRNSRNNLIDALGNVPNLELLGISHNFLPYLAKGNIPNQIPTRLNNLKIIQVDINLSDPKEANVTMVILQNALELEELHLLDCSKSTFLGEANQIAWENQQGIYLQMLKTITIDMHFITQSVFSFFKFVLGSAPHLEKIFVSTDENLCENKKREFIERVMQFPKESRNVEIKFM